MSRKKFLLSLLGLLGIRSRQKSKWNRIIIIDLNDIPDRTQTIRIAPIKEALAKIPILDSTQGYHEEVKRWT